MALAPALAAAAAPGARLALTGLRGRLGFEGLVSRALVKHSRAVTQRRLLWGF